MRCGECGGLLTHVAGCTLDPNRGVNFFRDDSPTAPAPPPAPVARDLKRDYRPTDNEAQHYACLLCGNVVWDRLLHSTTFHD